MYGGNSTKRKRPLEPSSRQPSLSNLGHNFVSWLFFFDSAFPCSRLCICRGMLLVGSTHYFFSAFFIFSVSNSTLAFRLPLLRVLYSTSFPSCMDSNLVCPTTNNVSDPASILHFLHSFVLLHELRYFLFKGYTSDRSHR